MKIFNEKKLEDLQKEFKTSFPYLKIEFFKAVHQTGMDTDEKEKLAVHLKVGEVRQTGKSAEWIPDGKIKVEEFERIMAKTFGLNVQVYRKEHGKWLQTWVTDIWTLEEQNNRSKVMGDKDNLLA